MKLNVYGQDWVEKSLAEIDEDKFYAAIGAYDIVALENFRTIRREQLTEIALEHQDDPEFQARNTPQA